MTSLDWHGPTKWKVNPSFKFPKIPWLCLKNVVFSG
jgi:hypothetical protein